MTTTNLTVQVDRRGQATVAKLIGSGDFRHVDDFSRRCDQIAAMRPSLLILDVTDLDFIASLMVGQIVAAMAASGAAQI